MCCCYVFSFFLSFLSFARLFVCCFRHHRRRYLHFVEWKFFHVSAMRLYFVFFYSFIRYQVLLFSFLSFCGFVRVCPIICWVLSTGCGQRNARHRHWNDNNKFSKHCRKCKVDGVCNDWNQMVVWNRLSLESFLLVDHPVRIGAKYECVYAFFFHSSCFSISSRFIVFVF